MKEAKDKYEAERVEIKREAELLSEEKPPPDKEPPRRVLPNKKVLPKSTPKQKAKKKRKGEPYVPKVIITKEEDGETVVVIDDGTGEDLEPVSSTEDSEEDSEEEEEVVQAVEVEAYDTNVIPAGEFEEEADEEDVDLPESAFAASVAETVANVVGASSQQSEEIKVTKRMDMFYQQSPFLSKEASAFILPPFKQRV